MAVQFIDEASTLNKRCCRTLCVARTTLRVLLVYYVRYAMTASDESINVKFIELEDKMTDRILRKLTELGVTTDALKEKNHFAIGIVQSFAHECIFDRHDYLYFDKMRSICTATIKNLFD